MCCADKRVQKAGCIRSTFVAGIPTAVGDGFPLPFYFVPSKTKTCRPPSMKKAQKQKNVESNEKRCTYPVIRMASSAEK